MRHGGDRQDGQRIADGRQACLSDRLEVQYKYGTMDIVAALPISPPLLTPPGERPGSDVVIYDGHCRICTAQIRRLPWWDCQRKLSYLSLHDPEVARRWPD
ncbi:MAG TPA: hypothetical protein VH107_10655, partial [Lacipirellulaceae bacterium]|nr:hypothetical protein [Lacipirellulaceae bacterium]